MPGKNRIRVEKNPDLVAPDTDSIERYRAAGAVRSYQTGFSPVNSWQ